MPSRVESDLIEGRPISADVPLSERPLVADGENTVITSPEKRRTEPTAELQAPEALRQRLFPANGLPNGEESGIQLAHYEIRERLGSGGMGAVFRATDLELSRDVALKILHPASAADASLVARFRNEARACAQLNHDNIARVYFTGFQDGFHFIAYELADGITIKELIQQSGQMTPDETVNYAIQVTLALNHIAAAGIVHRDIKPSNIMRTPTGRVKVVDLGLARRDITDSIGDITVAGTTLGTFDYIAPEQARDPSKADIRSDIYSLGCTMYHMLTGQPPYPDGNAFQKMLDHQGKSPPDPRSINARISPELAAVLKKMMANNPDARYQAPALLLSDLLQLARLMGLQSIPAEGIVWRRAGPVITRQPVGAIWVFASVLVICLTAFVMDRYPSRTLQTPVSDALAESTFQATPVDSFSSDAPPETSNDDASTFKSTTTGADAPGVQNAPTEMADNVNLLQQAASPLRHIWPSTPLDAIAHIGREASIRRMNVPQASLAESAAEVSAENPGAFLLQREGGDVQSFLTLNGAVADAKSGDVILLKYNGHPQEIVAQPAVKISGLNLIIRAADGFRPTLEFDGSSAGAVSRTEMFTLRNSSTLTIRDIDLRMVMRETVATDRWTMFRMDGANRLSLENVSIDCRNPIQQPASVIEMTDPPSISDETTGTYITLNRVVCRGEAQAVRISGQPQGRIMIQQSAFALAGSLIQNFGSATMLQTAGSLEVSLQHVTTLLSHPLIVMRDSDDTSGRGPQRTLPGLNVISDGCVFASASPEESLVISSGNSYLDDMQSTLSWTGFTNLYCGYSTLWQIDTSDMDFNGSRIFDMAQWRQYWENRSDGEESSGYLLTSDDSIWLDYGSSRARLTDPATVTSENFQLNPLLFQNEGGRFPMARDGIQPGAVILRLPSFPLRRTSTPSAAGTVSSTTADRIDATEESDVQ
ncbi:MAG: serine/threonine protein kinase [Planctomycetaceae bacterium]|nr:serine/threonine protein kinase [Planctomycetaceae bacterium]